LSMLMPHCSDLRQSIFLKCLTVSLPFFSMLMHI
jgi:hypothetical protein